MENKIFRVTSFTKTGVHTYQLGKHGVTNIVDNSHENVLRFDVYKQGILAVMLLNGTFHVEFNE